MSRKHGSNDSQILLFPSGEPVPVIDMEQSGASSAWVPTDRLSASRRQPKGLCDVVLSGSFRRDVEGLRLIHQELQDLGCVVLSPRYVQPAAEVDGFVFMKGEETETPNRIELRHLDAIEKAGFMWLHAPEGYVGLSASLEVGFAHAQGVPVFSRDLVSDPTLSCFVKQVDSPSAALASAVGGRLPVPTSSLPALQRYYKRVAAQRGYERETAQNCLLLMVEEVGELAHTIRKREKLVRHGTPHQTNAAHEVADVFLYIVHMANILGLDLGSAVREKEDLNTARFLRAQQ
jgi:NTP pyrophosphatase (non-canonical NTP hydrolase)